MAADVESPTGGGDKQATGGEAPAVGAKRALRTPLWDNGFFYIADNEGHPDCNLA